MPDRSSELTSGRIWVPFFGWIIVIFALSAYPKALIPQGKFVSWDKLAHLVEFGVLGYLTARAFCYSGKVWLQRNYLWLTLFFGVLYAASDEWHQHFIKGRNASLYDVLADGAGVLLGWLLFYLFLRTGSQRKPGSAMNR